MKASLQAPFSSYIIRKLGPEEKVKSFDCGDADLNDFILNESGFYRQTLLAVTYVFEAVDDENHEHIAAYFSLANDRVSMSDFPDKTAFNRFRKHRFVNEKRLKSYPATKICRLAVSQEFYLRTLKPNPQQPCFRLLRICFCLIIRPQNKKSAFRIRFSPPNRCLIR